LGRILHNFQPAGIVERNRPESLVVLFNSQSFNVLTKCLRDAGSVNVNAVMHQSCRRVFCLFHLKPCDWYSFVGT
jgi:hypothetical protein